MLSLLFGPVYEAAHSEPSALGGIFGIGIGVSVLSYVWFRYFTHKDEPRPPVYNVIGITAICSVFLVVGIRELLRALRM